MNTIKRIILVTLALIIFLPVLSQAVTGPQEDFWVTNGVVYSSVTDGSTIYIGGDFQYVGPHTGQGVAIDTVTGIVDSALPKIDGYVYVVVADGAGGWYIGGSFANVGGQARSNLAHIKADKTLDTAFNPNPDSTVQCLLLDGTTMYVGGGFASIGGQARSRIAALDTTVNTNNATSFDPDASNSVESLVLSGTTLYVGGYFNTIGGQDRYRIAALDTTTGNATAWDPNPDDSVYSMALSGSILYVVGRFESIGGQARNYIAALDTTTGNATAWNPDANASVRTLLLSGSTVYVGGYFTSIGGESRSYIAALDAAVNTNNAMVWNPGANFTPWSMVLSGSTLYVGGQFSSAGGYIRNNIAALSISDGSPTTWDPDADDIVYSLVLSGSTLYAGGDFATIGGQARSRIAALDTNTGNATLWDPGADGTVKALVLNGATLYAGGDFATIGGQTRSRIAAMDTLSDNATAWNPYADNTVNAMLISNSTLYVGGVFTSIGGQARSGIAALDTTVDTNCATTWNPAANPAYVNTMILSGSTLYVGGRFSSCGGESRSYIAALDITTGNATAWNPNATGGGFSKGIDCLALSDSTLYVGGEYTEIGGQTRNSLAALDTANGNASTWDPDITGIDLYPGVHSLVLSDSTLCAMGGFFTVSDKPRHGLATFTFVPPSTTVSPQGGTYSVAQSVVLTCSDASGTGCAATYYTTDGSTPTSSSSVYSSPISISTDTTLKFFSKDNEGTSESVNTEIYIIESPPPASSGGGGCFIATAAYGSPMEPYVKVLRDFRDRFMINNGVGKAFINLYSTYSPPVADFIASHDTVRLVVRWSLMPIVGMTWVALYLGPWITLALMGLLIYLLMLGVWVTLRRKVFLPTPL